MFKEFKTLIEMGTYFVFTEPERPSSFNNASSNLDASDKRIRVAWTAPAIGVSTGYAVKLLDGSTEVVTTTSTQLFTDLYYNDMLNGHVYTLEVKSQSQPFNGSQLVYSDAFTYPIKTVVQGIL